ncbi:MAG: GNAT family N-acetyltransferase [Deltaproteobacteria bacterium]|nr:GNAT family N-acetyltransferase [Deltaproteobacteria bacterium]
MSAPPTVIRECAERDREALYAVINEASALAYRAILPPEAYHEPQMPMAELQQEMARVRFFAAEAAGTVVGVMGYEYCQDVALIRHAYVRPAWQRRGIGAALLRHVEGLIRGVPRIVLGTYAANAPAIRFYEKHGYRVVRDSDAVLRQYYEIPEVQRQASIAMEKRLGTGV